MPSSAVKIVHNKKVKVSSSILVRSAVACRNTTGIRGILVKREEKQFSLCISLKKKKKISLVVNLLM